MKADIIREKFLKFFEGKGHKIRPSDSLVPKDDPTLLFTGAGMNQFKEYFLGIKNDMKRAATSQKCLRTGDVDNVGRTPSHHTFFEMLGNFSFGDYFKKEAIPWAWEFMIKELKIPQERMWVSVYEDDSEAYDIWHNDVKLPREKIKKLGDKDNFWPQEAKTKGPNGPCGPCSEIYVDDVEVWNLVFTQFNRIEGGALEPLPMKNIDTGMGLERIAAVMQGVRSNFETDLFVPIIEAIVSLCHSEALRSKAEESNTLDPSPRRLRRRAQDDKRYIYTIADHIRAVTFLIADGVLPSNEGRGYVERMLIRRAARLGKKLGFDRPFLYKLAPAVARIMKNQYPELQARRENICQVLMNEEERFSQTLEEGTSMLDGLMKAAKTKEISGDIVFKLYDTFGFPYDLTEEIAAENGFKLDKAGFQKAIQSQRETSRKSSAISADIFAATTAHKIKKIAVQTKFTGYDNLSCEAEVMAVLDENGEFWVMLDKTPFYGSSGGQVGDTGKITKISNPKTQLKVVDTKLFDNIIVHVCEIKSGAIKPGDKVKAEVDAGRRLDIAKNHTATHLLQAALRKVLGEHVRQSGSLVAPDRLRFDFSHFKPMTAEQIERVENLVNEKIKEGINISIKEMDLKNAVESGATALFGEKYDEKVRVVSIGDYSRELCGGTHLDNIKVIAAFKIISESSISAGVRRIEAVTGRFVEEAVKKEESARRQRAEKEREDKIKIESDKARRKALIGKTDEIIKNAKLINGIKVIAREIENADTNDLRGICDKITQSEPLIAVLLASKYPDKVMLVLAFSGALVKKGKDAAKLIRDISKIVSGSGGGRPDMAQAGGKDPSKIKEMFKKFEELI